MEKNKRMQSWIVLAVAVLVIGGGAFYGGMQYSRYSMTAGRADRFQGAGGPGMANRTAGSDSFTSGEVLSKDDKSITVKLTDGGSKIIFVSGTTQVMKSDTGSLADLTVGQQVSASGTANTDGSINATSVQIRPNVPTTTDAVKK